MSPAKKEKPQHKRRVLVIAAALIAVVVGPGLLLQEFGGVLPEWATNPAVIGAFLASVVAPVVAYLLARDQTSFDQEITLTETLHKMNGDLLAQAQKMQLQLGEIVAKNNALQDKIDLLEAQNAIKDERIGSLINRIEPMRIETELANRQARGDHAEIARLTERVSALEVRSLELEQENKHLQAMNAELIAIVRTQQRPGAHDDSP